MIESHFATIIESIHYLTVYEYLDPVRSSLKSLAGFHFSIALSNQITQHLRMKQIDGNIWLTAKIMDRIKELDIILDMLEARVSKYGTGSAMLNGTIKLTRSTHQLNVDILRKINPEYYRISKSTLIRQ